MVKKITRKSAAKPTRKAMLEPTPDKPFYQQEAEAIFHIMRVIVNLSDPARDAVVGYIYSRNLKRNQTGFWSTG